MTIAIDFDGTLHTGKWPAIGAPAPYARDVMKKLKNDGHRLIIWTCREGVPARDMINWLLEKDIPFDRVNDNFPDMIERYGYNARKIGCDLIIDDNQIGGLPGWNDIYDFVRGTENSNCHKI